MSSPRHPFGTLRVDQLYAEMMDQHHVYSPGPDGECHVCKFLGRQYKFRDDDALDHLRPHERIRAVLFELRGDVISAARRGRRIVGTVCFLFAGLLAVLWLWEKLN